MATVAFIGLGVMGAPMAGHLGAAGHQLRVWNRGRERLDGWLARHAGVRTASPREAATGAEFVFTCVGDDPDVEAVVCGEDGVLAGLAPGGVWIDHTTCSAALARRLAAQASALGLYALDAPVSGGQAGAENGTLTVMTGGERAAFERAEPVMRSYAKRVRLLGAAGAGQLTKMVNQICIAGLLQGLAEGLHFGERAGLDLEAVVEVLCAGAAQSWQMDHRHRSMAAGEFDFGFAVEWMRKDLRICLEEARHSGTALPVTAMVDQFYAEVMAMGGARWDTSSLIARLRQCAGDRRKEIRNS